MLSLNLNWNASSQATLINEVNTTKSIKFISMMLVCILITSLMLLPSVNASDENSLVFESAEATYSDGYVTVTGKLNNSYSSVHVFMEICDPSGAHISPAYTISNQDGSFSATVNTGELDPDADYILKLNCAKINGFIQNYTIYFDISTSDLETDSGSESTIPVTGINFTRNTIQLPPNSTASLTADVIPSDATIKNIIWESNNESVATVDDGLITAKSEGTAIITATTVDGGFFATCTVTVGGESGSSSISIPSLYGTTTIFIEEPFELSAQVSGVDPNTLRWSTSNSNILRISNTITDSPSATVSGSSTVYLHGLKEGTATLTVSSGSISSSYSFYVSENITPDDNIEAYYFYILFREQASYAADTQFASVASSGFWIAAYGRNAAEALENACIYYGIAGEDKLNLVYADKQNFRGWLGLFFGLGDEKVGTSDWRYWVQYKHDGSEWSYNNLSLGWYDTGGHFALIRTTTSVDGAPANLSNISPRSVPEGLYIVNPGEKLHTVTYNSNGGSASTQTDKVSSGKNADLSKLPGTREGYRFLGWNTSSNALSALSAYVVSADVTLYAVWISESATSGTTVNPDGSVTTTIDDEKTNDDGTVSSITQSTTVKEDEDGSKKTTVEKTEEVKDTDGNTQSLIEEKSEEIISSDGSVNKQSDVTKKDAEGNVLEESTSVEIKDSSDNIFTQAEIKKDADGNKSAESTTKIKTGTEVSEEDLKKAVEQIEEIKKTAEEKDTNLSSVLEIDTKSDSSSTSSSVSLSKSSLDSLAETGADVKILTDVGEIDMPSEVLKNVTSEEGEKVVLEIKKVNTEELDNTQKGIVKDSLIVDINLTIDGKKVSDLKEEIKVTLPYDLKSGEDANNISVYYLGDDGNITKMNTVYDSKTKTISFYTNHLSYYFVSANVETPVTPVDPADPVTPVDPADPDNPQDSTEKDEDSNIWIYAAAAAIIILVLLGVLFYLRKQNKL